METVIKLNGINKIYRTDEVETQALENVNLETSWDCLTNRRVDRLNCADR